MILMGATIRQDMLPEIVIQNKRGLAIRIDRGTKGH
jgi:hypothetical protein